MTTVLQFLAVFFGGTAVQALIYGLNRRTDLRQVEIMAADLKRARIDLGTENLKLKIEITQTRVDLDVALRQLADLSQSLTVMHRTWTPPPATSSHRPEE